MKVNNVEEFSTGLTPAEQERLTWLIEECSEVIKAGTKILRHGYRSYNPDKPAYGDNRRDLEMEIGDVLSAVGLMLNAEDIQETHITSKVTGREVKFGMRKPVKGKYMHFQPKGLVV